MTRERHIGSATPEKNARIKRDPEIKDYIISAPVVRFKERIASPPPSQQPAILFDVVLPHINLRDIGTGNSPFNLRFVRHTNQIAMVKVDDEAEPRLAIQLKARGITARHFIPAEAQEAVLAELEAKSPNVYAQLTNNAETDDGNTEIVSGDANWHKLHEIRRKNETFDVLKQVIQQSPSKKIRIERHQRWNARQDSYDTDDVLVQDENFGIARAHYVVSSIFNCELVEDDGEEAIRVGAKIPWYRSENTGKEMFDSEIYVFEDQIAMDPEKIAEILKGL